MPTAASRGNLGRPKDTCTKGLSLRQLASHKLWFISPLWIRIKSENSTKIVVYNSIFVINRHVVNISWP